MPPATRCFNWDKVNLFHSVDNTPSLGSEVGAMTTVVVEAVVGLGRGGRGGDEGIVEAAVPV